ncbi:hypothetical protein ACFFYR_16150 [Paraburkholderia dipogonis]
MMTDTQRRYSSVHYDKYPQIHRRGCRQRLDIVIHGILDTSGGAIEH